MPHFVLTCLDKPESLALRMSTREAHLAHLDDRVKLAGPFLDEAGQPCGSMLVVEADDLAAARAFADADPYAKAGLFQSVDVRPFRLVVGQL